MLFFLELFELQSVRGFLLRIFYSSYDNNAYFNWLEHSSPWECADSSQQNIMANRALCCKIWLAGPMNMRALLVYICVEAATVCESKYSILWWLYTRAIINFIARCYTTCNFHGTKFEKAIGSSGHTFDAKQFYFRSQEREFSSDCYRRRHDDALTISQYSPIKSILLYPHLVFLSIRIKINHRQRYHVMKLMTKYVILNIQLALRTMLCTHWLSGTSKSPAMSCEMWYITISNGSWTSICHMVWQFVSI